MPGWSRVQVKAAALNHHDVWTLRGVGIDASRLPITSGCDAAGIDDTGREVVVHGVIGDPAAGGGDETLDPKRSLLSEVHDGTFAEYVVVPTRNLLPKPAALSFEEAACLPVAWLTAYRMLATRSGLDARPDGARAGRGRRRRHRRDRAGPRDGPARVVHRPHRGQARPSPSRSAPTRRSSPAPGCRTASTR